MLTPALVLAGGKSKTGEQRAAIPFRGRPMLDYVVDALDSAESIGEIVVVGPTSSSARFRAVTDHGGFVENIYAGLNSVETEYALIATCDIPFLTPEAVDRFARSATGLGDVVYPIVRVEDCYARFPGIRRTAVQLKEGAFTGGNLALVNRVFMESQRERIARAYALRKSPIKLALMIGAGTALKLAGTMVLRRPLLSIHELEVSISRIIGGRGRAIISTDPELATDIDRESDLAAAESAEIRTPRAS